MNVLYQRALLILLSLILPVKSENDTSFANTLMSSSENTSHVISVENRTHWSEELAEITPTAKQEDSTTVKSQLDRVKSFDMPTIEPEESSEKSSSNQDQSSEVEELSSEKSSTTSTVEIEKSFEKSSSGQEISSETSTVETEESLKKSSSNGEIHVSAVDSEESAEKSSHQDISAEISTVQHEKSSEKSSYDQEISTETSSTDSEESVEKSSSDEDISPETSTVETKESLKESSSNEEISAADSEESAEKSSHRVMSAETSTVIPEKSSEKLSSDQEISSETLTADPGKSSEKSDQEISSDKSIAKPDDSFEKDSSEKSLSDQEQSFEKSTTETNDSSEKSSSDPEMSSEKSIDISVGSSEKSSSENETVNQEEPFATSLELENSSEKLSDENQISKITTSGVNNSIEIATKSISSTTAALEVPMSTPKSPSSNSTPQEFSVDGVYVRILGRSGKIVMGRTPNPNHDPNRLTVTLDSIRETDASGNIVGSSGRKKHSFNSFASQKFTFSDLTDDKYQNLSTKRVDFRAELEGVGAALTVQLYLFREAGSVSLGDEITRVSRGTLKFNIVIQNWTFCGTGGEECGRGRGAQHGEFVELALSIRGSRPPQDMKEKRTNAQEFGMGGRTSVVLSRLARYDDSSACEELPDGFPQTFNKGSNQLFLFRFRKFSKSVFYDPLLNMDTDKSSDNGETLATEPADEEQFGVKSTSISLTEEASSPPSLTLPSTFTSSPATATTSTSTVSTVSFQSPPKLKEINSTLTGNPLTPTQTVTTEPITEPLTTGATPRAQGNTTNSPDLDNAITTPVSSNFQPEETVEFSENGIFVHIMGRSGKIVMGRTPNPNHDPNRLTVTFDSIRETDASGNIVGSSGRKKHSFNSFTSQKFTFSELTDDKYQNLTTKRVDFRAEFEGVGASLAVQLYLFREGGNVSLGDEITRVSRGTLKFNIVIQNWTFCGAGGEECGRGRGAQHGEFVDLALSFRGRMTAVKRTGSKRTSAQEFYLGGNASVILSEKVKYDESSGYVNLPTGFPKMIRRGTQELFLFRFQKFNKTIFYDPQLDINGDSLSDSESDADVESPPNSSDTVPEPAEISTRTAFLSAEGLTVGIHGKSGKMTIGYGDDPDRDSNKVTVTFDAIREIAADGTDIGPSGGQAHSFNTFANLDFEFSTIKDDQYMNTSSKRIDFTADLLATGARMIVQAFVFTQSGEIIIDGEKTRITPGTVKFNILIESWRFCGSSGLTCRVGNAEQRGEAIDLNISIKGRGEQQVRAGRGKTDGEEFDLGGQASLLLSKKIQRDGGSYETMPPGYPQLSPRGSQEVFTLRFPRFNSSVLYDPMIVLSSTNGMNSSYRWTPTSQVLIFVLILLSTRVFKTT